MSFRCGRKLEDNKIENFSPSARFSFQKKFLDNIDKFTFHVYNLYIYFCDVEKKFSKKSNDLIIFLSIFLRNCI